MAKCYKQAVAEEVCPGFVVGRRWENAHALVGKNSVWCVVLDYQTRAREIQAQILTLS